MHHTTRRILGSLAAVGILSLAAALPATASPDPGPPGSSTHHPHHVTPRHASPPTVNPDAQVADNSPEYLQIGLGALAGMAVAGGAVVGVRRLGHRAPHPA